MKPSNVSTYINELADTIREEGCIDIEGALYCYDDFPPGFWRKLVKEVNYVESLPPKPTPPPLRDLKEGDIPRKTPFPRKERIRDYNGI
jgi:hypothetical protein